MKRSSKYLFALLAAVLVAAVAFPAFAADAVKDGSSFFETLGELCRVVFDGVCSLFWKVWNFIYPLLKDILATLFGWLCDITMVAIDWTCAFIRGFFH